MATGSQALVSQAELKRRLGNCSDMTIWRLRFDTKLLPPPLKIGGRNFWTEGDYEALVASAEAARHGKKAA